MDRELILSDLVGAELAIVKSEQRITKQRALIDSLSRRGLDTTDARSLLHVFEQSLAALVAGRARLREALEQTT
jgi:hypothetical protein